MVQIILVGLGAGIAAALLFASLASGLLLSFALFYLAPLPILIVALGWSHWAGLIAALVGSAGLAANQSDSPFLIFLLGVGLPAWWLSYLALLARPVAAAGGNGATPVVEWYPVGRLVLWSAILSASVITAALLSIGTSEETLRERVRESIELLDRLTNAKPNAPALPNLARRLDTLLHVVPPAMAVSVTLVNLMSLWLAGRIVKLSGRLRRPWPDLTTIVFPALTSAFLAAAGAGIMLAGLIGIVSSVYAAGVATAYVVLGFAVLHSITRGAASRGLVLTGAYTASVFLWPMLVLIALLGLADSAFDIRGRFGKKRGPPKLPT